MSETVSLELHFDSARLIASRLKPRLSNAKSASLLAGFALVVAKKLASPSWARSSLAVFSPMPGTLLKVAISPFFTAKTTASGSRLEHTARAVVGPMPLTFSISSKMRCSLVLVKPKSKCASSLIICVIKSSQTSPSSSLALVKSETATP